MKNKLSKAYNIIKKDGFYSLINSVKGYVYWRLKPLLARFGIVPPYHDRKRTDSEERWEWISKQLELDDSSAMDIGCASGFFSAKLSNRGLFTIGIEPNHARLNNAKRLYGENERLAFMHSKITPATITDLPSVDVVLLLTVYHHWTRAFGQGPAEEMLRSLASKSDKIFFEPPGDIGYSENFSKYQISEKDIDENESIQAYYEDLLSSIFDETVSVIHLGTAPYPSDKNRTDPVFMIKCDM